MNSEKQWLERRESDPDVQEIYRFLKDGDAADAYYKHCEFGTAGMRGLLGPGANRLNKYTIRRATAGFAKYVRSLEPTHPQRGVAIAYDNRHFSKMFALEAARVLASYEIDAFVFEGLRPTPELSFAVRHLHALAGIMITASHNPREYNGYKVYDANGCQLVPAKIAEVIALIDQEENELDIEISVSARQQSHIHWIGTEIDAVYLDRVAGIQLRPQQKKDDLTIVYTSQHGTGYPLMDRLFTRCGYPLHIVTDQCVPDPDFSHTLSPNPEEHQAYREAIALAREIKADLILCTDPDADRMGIVVAHQDDYVFITGNQGGSILQEYIYSTRQAQQTMPDHPVMFNTIVTSDLGEKIAGAYGVSCEKTLTGFKYIGDKIAAYEKTGEKQFVFGYEESYGYLIEPFVRDKDAFQACLLVAEAAAYYQGRGETLVDVLNRLYQTYGTYYETQTSLSLSGSQGQAKIQAILANFRTADPETFAGMNVVAFADYLSGVRIDNGTRSDLDFPRENVLKYYLEDGSWIAIRPSGTEPKCKFYYCIKGDDESQCLAKFAKLSQELRAYTV